MRQGVCAVRDMLAVTGTCNRNGSTAVMRKSAADIEVPGIGGGRLAMGLLYGCATDENAAARASSAVKMMNGRAVRQARSVTLMPAQMKNARECLALCRRLLVTNGFIAHHAPLWLLELSLACPIRRYQRNGDFSAAPHKTRKA